MTAAIIGVGAAATLDMNDVLFMEYITKFNKNFDTMEEYQGRKARFLEIDSEINILNSTQSDSRHAHNKLSDWYAHEIEGLLLQNIQAPDPEKI
jgi:hypothetical protein